MRVRIAGMLLPIYQVDAFSSHQFAGNPAAVIPLLRWPADELLQKIANENNLSETAFFLAEPADDRDDFHLRWFTPLQEVDLCGHATLATAHVLMRLRGWPAGTLRFRTRSGSLVVRAEKGRYLMNLPSRPAEPADLPAGVADALGAEPTAVLSAECLLCRFETEEDVRRLAPEFSRLRALDAPMIIATAPADDDRIDFVSRFFAPVAGVDEDPVTGSAHCTLVPYWAEELGQTELTARQISSRGGELTGCLDGDRVVIGGEVATYMEGSITIAEEAAPN